MIIDAETIARVFGYGMIAWFFAIALYIFYTMITQNGGIGRLIESESGEQRSERVASLAITLAVAGYYISTALSGDLKWDDETGMASMPDIPASLLAVLVGGKSLYIAGKLSGK